METTTHRHSLFIFSSKENRRFFASVLFFVVLTAALFLHVMPQYLGSYQSSLIDKVQRLRETTGPKIVLIGHSDLVYGIQSEKLEQALGMPVVNMGFGLGMGFAFNEELCRLNVQAGDIYILSRPTYADGYTKWDPQMDPLTAWCAVEDHFELWPLLYEKVDGEARRPVKSMVKAFPTYIRRCLQRYADGTGNIDAHTDDSRSAFNVYGDVAYPHPGPIFELTDDFDEIEKPVVEDKTVARLNELNAWLQERGAHMLLTWFPIAKGTHEVDEAYYAAIQEEINQKIDAPLITDYSQAIYDYTYYYNYWPHLNDEGAALHTQRLIQDIEKWMAETRRS